MAVIIVTDPGPTSIRNRGRSWDRIVRIVTDPGPTSIRNAICVATDIRLL